MYRFETEDQEFKEKTPEEIISGIDAAYAALKKVGNRFTLGEWCTACGSGSTWAMIYHLERLAEIGRVHKIATGEISQNDVYHKSGEPS